MHFDPKNQRQRWVAFLDLLGTRSLISQGRSREVFESYRSAISELTRKERELIDHAWFSDSFLLVAPDASIESFFALEQAARQFAYKLLCARIPLRGAIACDEMYFDPASSVFFGNALVEAYEYGEGQDWLALLLTPTAVSRLEQLDAHVSERLNYALCKPAWKRRPKSLADDEELGACVFGASAGPDGTDTVAASLRSWAAEITNPCIRIKYDRTAEFIESNPRRFSTDG